MRILFIGNSYTFFNDVPAAVSELSRRDGAPWTVGRYLRGGSGMRTHFCDNFGLSSGRGRYCPELVPERAGGLDKLLEEPWDAVVLHGQSMDTVETPDDFFAYGKVLGDRILAAGVPRLVLEQTWARRHFPEMLHILVREYDRLARALGAEVLRCGEAWDAALKGREGLVLHTDDRKHPNDRGSYLNACMLYRLFSGNSAVGLPHELPMVKWGDSSPDGTCYHLDAGTAAYLQEIADRF